MAMVKLQWGLAGYHSNFRLDRHAFVGSAEAGGFTDEGGDGALSWEDLLILLCVHGTFT